MWPHLLRQMLTQDLLPAAPSRGGGHTEGARLRRLLRGAQQARRAAAAALELGARRVHGQIRVTFLC